MSFKVPRGKERKDYGRIGEGTFPARIVQIIGLGRHENTNWQTGAVMLDDDGKPKPPTNKVMITYELPTETIEIDGEQKPRWTSKEYNLFFSDKAALAQVLNAAAEGSDDLEDALGKAVSLTIGTTSGGKDKVTAVTKLMKGVEVAELSQEAKIFNFDDPDIEVYNNLFDWQKKKMQEAVNFKKSKLESMLSNQYASEAAADAATDQDTPDDDIPF